MFDVCRGEHLDPSDAIVAESVHVSCTNPSHVDDVDVFIVIGPKTMDPFLYESLRGCAFS